MATEEPTARTAPSTGAPASPILGINTCFAVKRWPEPERWLAIVREDLGLRHCQVSLDLFEPGLDPAAARSGARAVADAARRAGVVLHSTFTGLAAYSSNLLLHPDEGARRAALRWFERAVDLTAEMGASGTGGFVGALSVHEAADAATRNQRLAQLDDALHTVAERASDAGLSFLLFENMAVEREFGHAIAEAHEIERRTAGSPVPWILCLDLGHPCALTGGGPDADPLAWLAEEWRHPPVLQIQQANRDGDFHWPFTAAHNAIGLVDPTEVVDALGGRSDGDATYLFFEIIHPAEYPDGAVVAELRDSVDCWQQALAGSTPRPDRRHPG